MDEFVHAYYVAQMGLYVTQIVNHFKFLKASVEKEVSGAMAAVSLAADAHAADLETQAKELAKARERFAEAVELNRGRLRLVRVNAEKLRDFLGTEAEQKAGVLERIFSSFLAEYLFKHEMRSTLGYLHAFYGPAEQILELGLEKYQNCREIALDLAHNSTAKLSQWCRANRSKLRRAKSDLEFKVHARQFYQMVPGADTAAMLELLQTHLAGLTVDPDAVFELVRVLMAGEPVPMPRQCSIQSLTSEFCCLYFEIEGFNKNYFLENLVAVG